MKIYKEKSGVISDHEVWVCIHDDYLYVADTLQELVEILNTEWDSDKNFVGSGI